MTKILQVFPAMNNAGTEKVIMNIYNNVDKAKIQMDFLVQREGELDEMIKASGARIYYIEKKDKKDYIKDLTAFFSDNNYTAVHVHMHGDMGLVLKAAKKAGIKHRIAHSHNSRPDLPRIAKLYKLITGIDIMANANHLFACSQLAAQWLFPAQWRKCKIVNNAIELDKFEFNQQLRNRARSEMGFTETDKIVCHIGRFSKQKNHARLIRILNQMIESDKSIKAMLIGDGPLFYRMKELANSENIIFLGKRTNVHELLNAADVFVLPSLHEGLPVVLVEAQVNGLYCVTSDKVSKETDIGSSLLRFISLQRDNAEWIKYINSSFSGYDRKEKSQLAYKSNFDIKSIGKEMEQFYTSLN